MDKSAKYTYISVLKILAIFCILYFHNGVYFPDYFGKSGYWFYLASTVLSYLGVPMFFMISGALLLNREESYGTLLKKRILKYAAALVVFSAVCYVYGIRTNLSALNLRFFVDGLLSFGHSSHLWYLYAYLAFLFMLPFLRKLAKSMTNTDFLYLLIIYFLFKMLPVFQFFAWRDNNLINADFRVAFFAALDVFAYPLFGYYMHCRTSDELQNAKAMPVLIISGLAFVIAEMLLTNIKLKSGTESPEPLMQFGYTFAPFFTAAVFLAVKALFEKHPWSEKAADILKNVSGCVFGVYLLQEILTESTNGVYTFLISHNFGPYWATIIWLFCALVLGIASTYVLKLIPVIKELL